MAEDSLETVKVTIDVSDESIFIFPSTSPKIPKGMKVNQGFILEPGQTFAGWTFNEMRLLGDGTHDIVRTDLVASA